MLAEAPSQAADALPLKPGEEERSRLLAKTCIVEAFRKFDANGVGSTPTKGFLHVVCLLFFPLSEKDAMRLLTASGALEANGQSVNYLAFAEWIMGVPSTPRAQAAAPDAASVTAPPNAATPPAVAAPAEVAGGAPAASSPGAQAAPAAAAAPEEAAGPSFEATAALSEAATIIPEAPAAAPEEAAFQPANSGDLELSLSRPLSEATWAVPGTGELGALQALEEAAAAPAQQETMAYAPREQPEEQLGAPLKASPPPVLAATPAPAPAPQEQSAADHISPDRTARHLTYAPEEDAEGEEDFDPARSAARIDRLFNFMLKEWDQDSEVPDGQWEAEPALRGPRDAQDDVEVQPAPLVQQKAPPPPRTAPPVAPSAQAQAMVLQPGPAEAEAQFLGLAEREAGDNVSAALRLTQMLKEELISSPEGEWAGRLQGSSRAELGKLLELLSSPSARDLVDLLNGQSPIPPPVPGTAAC